MRCIDTVQELKIVCVDEPTLYRELDQITSSIGSKCARLSVEIGDA